MKMVKSLLLGSAAGLVAVVGAQAADLPVKAKPVEYVRVCSLYGAGFWYVPGTDTCLKIGSYVREQLEWNAGNGGVPIGFEAGGDTGAGRFTRTDTSQLSFRTRASISVDLRTQTEYGTLRSYLEGGFQTSANNGSAPANDVVYFDRGFIQFAGFTAGRIRSFFDINSFAPYGYHNVRFSADTGALGLWGIGYTAQLGNGVSATISFEDGGSTSQGNNIGQNSSRGHQIINLSLAAQFGLGTTSFDNEGWTYPDVIGALRIDQAWGYAQLSAALHGANGGYYTAASGALDACGANAFCSTLGHPGSEVGFAVSGGFTLNNVLGLQGDTFGMSATYGVGANGYVFKNGASQVYGSGNSAGFGWTSDGVFVNGGNIELTTAWAVNGAFQHIWSPRWRTSIYGGYYEVDYNGTATSTICAAPAAPLGFALTAVSNCSPNWSSWTVGSRTQWNPHPDLDVGVDVMWSHLNTAFAGTASLAANGARPAGLYQISDQDVVSVAFRIQRNFLP